MNVAKTEYLRVGEEDEDPDLQLRQIRKCEEYKYLGSTISNKGSSVQDVRHRVQQGQKGVRVLNPLLWSNRISLKTQPTFYRAIVEPILTYGSECWQLTESARMKIDAVEIDFLRRSCRISRLEHIPNVEIRRLTNRIHRTTKKNRNKAAYMVWTYEAYGRTQMPKKGF